MAKNIRLTPALLRKLVLQEKKKIQEALEKGEESVEDVHAEEVEPGDEADTLEKDINWMAALKIQESILKKKYAKVQKAKKRLVKKISKR